jgi:hypothetical protein
MTGTIAVLQRKVSRSPGPHPVFPTSPPGERSAEGRVRGPARRRPARSLMFIDASPQHPRSMHRPETRFRPQAIGKCIAHAAAHRIDQVFFRMAVGRVVDPFAAAALAAVRLEGVLQPRAPRVDREVAAFHQQVDSARCQHASSSAQRVSTLSPRARSGSSPLKQTARAPLGQATRRFEDSN